MKIGVDAGCLGIKDERLKVGVYNVVMNFLIELGKIDKNNQYLLYTFDPINKNLLAKFGNNFKNIVVKPGKGWLKLWLPLRISVDKPDLFLALNQSLPGSRFFGLRPQNDKMEGTKIIGFVYDIAFEEFPEMYVPDSVPKMKQNSRELVKKSDTIITISNWTKNKIVNLYKIDKNKIKVLYPGVRRHSEFISEPCPKRAKIAKEMLNRVQHDKYFLFVGALKKSKNIPAIINAFAQFIKKTGERYNLYIAGGDKWLDKEISKTVDKFKLQNSIRVFGYVDDETLLRLYREAFAFVSPSLYEGFGITLIEAMSNGCPIIAGNNSAQKEVLSDAGILVDSKDINAITNAMLSMAKDENLRLNFIRKGLQRSKLFSWKKFASEVHKKIKEYEYKTN